MKFKKIRSCYEENKTIRGVRTVKYSISKFRFKKQDKLNALSIPYVLAYYKGKITLEVLWIQNEFT